MKEIDLIEISKSVKEQMPLMYASTGLIFLGLIILFILISDFIFSFVKNKCISKSDKKMVIILSITLAVLVSGISIYFLATLRMAETMM